MILDDGRKYRSLSSTVCNKIDNILKNIKEFDTDYKIPKNINKINIKTIIKNENVASNTIFKRTFDDTLSIDNFKNDGIEFLFLCHDYNFLKFIILYDIPLIIKNNINIFCFKERDVIKFVWDINFLSTIFLKKNVNDSLFLLHVLKQYKSV